MENSHLKIVENTGLGFVLYDFRHTFATRFYEATKGVIALAAVLGHANLRTVMRYVHISQDHHFAAMAMYERTIAKDAKESERSSGMVQ